MLHRARAERVEAAVDRVILLRQPGEMADHLRLAEARQADRALPFEPAEADAERRRLGQIDAAMARRILLEDQRLFDLQPAIAADRLDRPGAVAVAGGRSAAWLHSLIAAPPASPASSRSMSSSVVVSVAATSSRSARSARPG